MIVTGVYLKKDTLPQVLMIKDVALKHSYKSVDLSNERKALQDSIVSTVTAVMKVMNTISHQAPDAIHVLHIQHLKILRKERKQATELEIGRVSTVTLLANGLSLFLKADIKNSEKKTILLTRDPTHS